MPTAPTSVAAVLVALLSEPGRPRITWYGPDGERVELSGAVLDNWVSKTTNLLVEEFDAEPGSRVRIDLPVHWRTLIWALATWRCGAELVPAPGTGAPPDVLVTDRPGTAATVTEAVIAVALPALARGWIGAPLPAGTVDAAAAVMTYPDAIGWVAPTAPDRAALDDAGLASAPTTGPLPHAGLVAAALATAPVPPGSRVLLRVGDGDSSPRVTGPELLRVLGVLALGGSVVLVSARQDERVRRIATDERVTATL